MKSTERTDFRTMRRRCAFGSVRYNVSRKVDGIVGREHRGTKGDCRVPRSVRAVVSSDEVKACGVDDSELDKARQRPKLSSARAVSKRRRMEAGDGQGRGEGQRKRTRINFAICDYKDS
ncbi:uncharacterized protein LOC143895897 isoform X3 [Temnothorax americanus]|uniref:uncharacterized protein LOC143895897 isoform X3 n=1 Tax=Temnothorax americanus TaxID=1964332 RepID=UPI0040692E33